MIIGDLDFVSRPLRPFEDDSELIVDPNAAEVFHLALEPLQPVPRRNPKVDDVMSRVNHVQLSMSRTPNLSWERPGGRSVLPIPDVLGRPAAECSDHLLIV